MQIAGLQKLTLIDYPGKIACAVFLIGCNFRCGFCHNPELVLPEKIRKQQLISEKDFFKFLKEKKGLLEGVCIGGGEPIIHKDLPDFIEKIKILDYLVKLDTNGSNPEMLKKLIDKKLVSYVAMDLKMPLGAFKSQISNLKSQIYKSKIKNKYEQVVSVETNLDKIRKSIEVIKNSGIEYEFRTTVVPGIHTKEDIIQIAKEISPAKKYFLQNFRSEKTIDPKFKKIKFYPQEFLLKIQKEISPLFETCQVR
jgi:pyruvate formate lyase activating enzyme